MKLALALALLTLGGCSKSSPDDQKQQEAQLAAALASALKGPPATPTGTAPAPTPQAPAGGIVATCNTTGDGICTETMGVQGFSADESCKRLGGVYTNGATPCPHDNLLGTCARVDSSSGVNDLDYQYKQPGLTDAAMKDLCESIKSGKWTSAPKGAGVGPKGKK